MGKTRLAAEIAGEAHREGAAVLYAAGTGPPEAALAAIARARETRRPALLVLDDADRAPADVRSRCATSRRSVPAGARAGHRAGGGGARAARAARVDALEPLDADGVQRSPASTPPPVPMRFRVRTLLATSGGVPARRVHEAASGWAPPRGDAPRRRRRRARRPGAPRPRAMVNELAGIVVACSRPTSAPGSPATARTPRHRQVCPYKGLATFDADATRFPSRPFTLR